MKFSVLVPVYNEEEYLPDCIESLKRQTFRDFEIVLVDDGSTDNSGKICDDFQNQENYIRVIHKQNEGLISARRVGIAKAQGEYCIFLDSDDMLEPYALEVINRIIDTFHSDLVMFNAYNYDGKNKDPFSAAAFPDGIIEDKKQIYDKYLMSYILNALCMKAVKRTIVDADQDYSKFYKFNFGEDLLQSVPITIKATSIYYTSRCLYDYRVQSGMMRKYSPQYYWSYRKVNLDIREKLRGEKIDNFDKKVGFHLLVAAYGGITQFKYADKVNKIELDKIRNDEEFKWAYQTVFSSDYKEALNKKQRLILQLIDKRLYWIIGLLLKIRRR